MRKSTNSSGVITVLVSLLLVGILSLGTVVLEAGRLQAAKTQLAEATASASTSMIAAYDSDLYERYGLLAIDTERYTLERCSDYLEFNSDLAVGYRGNRVTRMYAINQISLQSLYNLTEPSVLKRQILARAKYHVIPQNYALNINTMNAFFSDFQNKCQYVSDKLTMAANDSAAVGDISDVNEDLLKALKTLHMTFKDAERSDSNFDITLSAETLQQLPSLNGPVESEASAEYLADLHTTLADATTVLGADGSLLSYGNGTVATESDVNVDISVVQDIRNELGDISSVTDMSQTGKKIAANVKQLAQGFNTAINMLTSDAEGNLLLNSYIIEYFSNRNNRIRTYAAPAKGTSSNGTMQNATFASACVEYVFGNSESERTNQEITFEYLEAIRLINNLYSCMVDSARFNEANLYSVVTHIAWANYESYIDTELQAKYGVTVPFNKNKMILNISKAGDVASAFNDKDLKKAMKTLGFYNGTNFNVPGSYQFSYVDSLSFALWFTSNTDKMLRIADLIQLEMRYREQYVEKKTAEFLMDSQNTYCEVHCESKFTPLLPIISIDSNNNVRGISIQSTKYAGY